MRQRKWEVAGKFLLPVIITSTPVQLIPLHKEHAQD